MSDTNSPTVDIQGWVRWVANVLQLIGYFLLLHTGGVVGLSLKALSDVLILYWAWRNSLYDVIGVTAIFTLMNSERLYELLFLS
jgi:hypothetical protein